MKIEIYKCLAFIDRQPYVFSIGAQSMPPRMYWGVDSAVGRLPAPFIGGGFFVSGLVNCVKYHVSVAANLYRYGEE